MKLIKRKQTNKKSVPCSFVVHNLPFSLEQIVFFFLYFFLLSALHNTSRKGLRPFFLILLHKKGRQLSSNVFKTPRGYQQKRKTKKKVTKIGEKKKTADTTACCTAACVSITRRKESKVAVENAALQRRSGFPYHNNWAFFFLLRHSPPSLLTDIRLHTTDKQTRTRRPPVSRERKKKHPSFLLFVFFSLSFTSGDAGRTR